jgi:hypothetical protein
MIDEKYRTSDLWLAGYCIANGIKLDRLVADPNNSRHILFELSGDSGEAVNKIADSYHQGGAVCAKKFKQTAFDLRGRVFKMIKELEDNGAVEEE